MIFLLLPKVFEFNHLLEVLELLLYFQFLICLFHFPNLKKIILNLLSDQFSSEILISIFLFGLTKTELVICLPKSGGFTLIFNVSIYFSIKTLAYFTSTTQNALFSTINSKLLPQRQKRCYFL
jgi:hypothetical protein